jgi:hypothetical protein
MADTWLVLLIIGFSAGLLGGLLGIGGGIILMPVLRFFIGLSPAAAAGTTVAAVFITTLGGGIKHYRLGHVPLRGLLPVIISGAVSTLFFSILFLQLARRGHWLDLGIGCVFSILSLRIIWDIVSKKNDVPDDMLSTGTIHGTAAGKVVLGGIAGILPGLFGIGTGAVLVPAFRYFFGNPVKVAIGSALVCFCANAFISAGIKYAQGYVDPGPAVPICLGCLAGSQLGAVINHRAPSRMLMLLFGLVFLWVSAQFIITGLKGMP